jgi:arabinofuranosyltransferase
MIWTGLLLAPLGLLFALLGARVLHQRYSPGRPLLPVGAAVVLALPPFWDFATSGLEDSLIFCWLGLCWWLLAGLRTDSRGRACWLAFVAGLGWLVRPDLAIGTVALLAALWYIVRPGWRRSALVVVVAGGVPMAYQVFRMGYYGLLVPNTAVAKDASSIHFPHGLTYLTNFISPYLLWIPLLLLPVLFPLTVGRRLDRADIVRCAAVAGSGALMAAYVTAIGGDFMHGRMLLPATFALLLPVMALPVPALSSQVTRTAVSGVYVAVIALWALTYGVHGRITQLPGIVPPNGIADERAFYVAMLHQQYPDDGTEYVPVIMATKTGIPEVLISRAASSGKAVLIYQAGKGSQPVSVPLSRPGYAVADVATFLGAAGAGTPLDGLVVDQQGLSYALGSHQDALPDSRPGHTRWVWPAWIVAEYSNVSTAPGIPAVQIAAARKALSCGALAELDQATQAPLTAGRFVSNLVHSLSLTTARFSADPVTAEKQLCS